MDKNNKENKQTIFKTDAKIHVESLLRGVAGASRSLLMLDYDGTIAPFHKNRDQAFPYIGFSPLLEEIVRTRKTRVVIISGRDANEVIPLLNIQPHPEVWGLHGLQRLKPDGSVDLTPLDEATSEALAAAENWLLYQHLEHTAEVKGGSIAVHWRGLGETEEIELRGKVLLGWKPIARYTHLHLMEFDGGVEIRTREADKGDAVRTILSEMEPHVPAAYLGDDSTDEHAFEAMNGHGLSVLVRPRYRPTAAQLWLRPPDEVLDLLEQWLEACQKGNVASDNKTWVVDA